MSGENLFLLLLSVFLSAGRNLLSKNISGAPFGKRHFFLFQSFIFFSGALVLLVLSAGTLLSVSLPTLFYALVYGALLISAQWCYTAALSSGNTSVCATVYSMGFLLPTLSGMLFWAESVTLGKTLGILAAAATVCLSGLSKKGAVSSEGKNVPAPMLVIAMLASGGLGILQKIQQSSPYAQERSVMLLIAFLLAGAASLFSALRRPGSEEKPARRKSLSACCAGLCFAACNLLNTLLAGRLDSAVFFPVLNIGTILLSFVLGVLLFREKLSGKQLLILPMGILSILLIHSGL